MTPAYAVPRVLDSFDDSDDEAMWCVVSRAGHSLTAQDGHKSPGDCSSVVQPDPPSHDSSDSKPTELDEGPDVEADIARITVPPVTEDYGEHDFDDEDEDDKVVRTRKRSRRALTPASDDDESLVDSDYAVLNNRTTPAMSARVGALMGDYDDLDSSADEDEVEVEDRPTPAPPSRPRAASSTSRLQIGRKAAYKSKTLPKSKMLKVGDSWASKDAAYDGIRAVAAAEKPVFSVVVRDSRTERAVRPGKPAFAILQCGHHNRGCAWRVRLHVVDGRWQIQSLERKHQQHNAPIQHVRPRKRVRTSTSTSASASAGDVENEPSLPSPIAAPVPPVPVAAPVPPHVVVAAPVPPAQVVVAAPAPALPVPTPAPTPVQAVPAAAMQPVAGLADFLLAMDPVLVRYAAIMVEQGCPDDATVLARFTAEEMSTFAQHLQMDSFYRWLVDQRFPAAKLRFVERS